MCPQDYDDEYEENYEDEYDEGEYDEDYDGIDIIEKAGQEYMEKLNTLSKKIVSSAKNMILIKYRFLDVALMQLDFKITDKDTYTDGYTLYFNKEKLLRGYANDSTIVLHEYLHVLMHCIFQHLYFATNKNADYWDLACDILVEHLIASLELYPSTPEFQMNRYEEIIKIESEVYPLTPFNVYAYLQENVTDPNYLQRLKDLFYVDDHSIWYVPHLIAGLGGEDDEEGASGVKVRVASFRAGDKSTQGNEHGFDCTLGSLKSELQQEIWEKIANALQIDLETFSSQQQGFSPGNFLQQLREVNREPCDYKKFLKKFSSLKEEPLVNVDEFDYIFYTYGLNNYNRMPLIEPLEYKETYVVRDFVIAIDTSGSTSGKLAQDFLQKTYNIMKSVETFNKKMNVFIIQCDCDIQEVVNIKSAKELERYINTMVIRGLGGTDFRPVFKYVDKLLAEKQLTKLGGMIYLTDGYGTFPTQMPKYKVAVVFIDDTGYSEAEVPGWAMKVVLTGNEIIEL